MTRRIIQGEGAFGLDVNAILRSLDGYGVTRGCAVTLGAEGSMEATVASGEILVGGERVDVSQQTINLVEGDIRDPRRDFIYVDRFGDADLEAGDPNLFKPSGRTGRQTWEPAWDVAANLDGVPVAGLLVPDGATDTGDIGAGNVTDLRIPPAADGEFPSVGAEPSDEELLAADAPVYWFNPSAGTNGEVHYYNPNREYVEALTTTDVRSVGTAGTGNDPLVVEDFETGVGNWVGETSKIQITGTDVFLGSGAMRYPNASGSAQIWSLPGNGLGSDTYFDVGETAQIAIDASQAEQAHFGFAKQQDTRGDCYRCLVDQDGGRFILYRADGWGTDPGDDRILAEDASVSYGSGYHIVQVDYDGNGDGQHVARLYTTSGGGTGTLLSTLNGAQDTTYRGRGYEIGGIYEYRADDLRKLL